MVFVRNDLCTWSGSDRSIEEVEVVNFCCLMPSIGSGTFEELVLRVTWAFRVAQESDWFEPLNAYTEESTDEFSGVCTRFFLPDQREERSSRNVFNFGDEDRTSKSPSSILLESAIDTALLETEDMKMEQEMNIFDAAAVDDNDDDDEEKEETPWPWISMTPPSASTTFSQSPPKSTCASSQSSGSGNASPAFDLSPCQALPIPVLSPLGIRRQPVSRDSHGINSANLIRIFTLQQKSKTSPGLNLKSFGGNCFKKFLSSGSRRWKSLGYLGLD